MVFAMIGLHGSGKSHLARLLAETSGGFYLNKREFLERHFGKKFASPDDEDSIRWYRGLYQSEGIEALTRLVIVAFAEDRPTILDAVHNPMELDIIRGAGRTTMPLGVFAPDKVRASRNSALDAVLDVKRVKYWHQSAEVDTRCLASEIEWAFTGIGDHDAQRLQCESLLRFLRESGGAQTGNAALDSSVALRGLQPGVRPLP